MNDMIRAKLAKIRRFCAKNPNSITVVNLSEPVRSILAPKPGAEKYFDFLRESDGARFGIVDFFSLKLLPQRQLEIDEVVKVDWYCIGQILYEPLLVHNETGLVAKYGVDARHLTEMKMDFDEFLYETILGSRYAELCPRPEDDHWFQSMQSLGLLTRE